MEHYTAVKNHNLHLEVGIDLKNHVKLEKVRNRVRFRTQQNKRVYAKLWVNHYGALFIKAGTSALRASVMDIEGQSWIHLIIPDAMTNMHCKQQWLNNGPARKEPTAQGGFPE